MHVFDTRSSKEDVVKPGPRESSTCHLFVIIFPPEPHDLLLLLVGRAVGTAQPEPSGGCLLWVTRCDDTEATSGSSG